MRLWLPDFLWGCGARPIYRRTREMNNDDIKSANRKAMPKFVLLTLISTVAGGAVGYISAGLVRLGGRCRL